MVIVCAVRPPYKKPYGTHIKDGKNRYICGGVGSSSTTKLVIKRRKVADLAKGFINSDWVL